MSNHVAALVALVAVAGCTYEAPLDPAKYVPENTIAGLIVAEGVPEGANTIVFVFDARNPPPPVGTGRPLTYSVVAKEAFNEAAIGVQSAPYAVPYLDDAVQGEGLFPEGYLVMALMDGDNNFSAPWAPAMGGSTCGDYVGVTPSPVFVQGGEYANNVTVVIEREQDIQRPAFTFLDPEDMPVISKDKGSKSALSRDPTVQNVQQYFLKNVPISTTYESRYNAVDYELPGPCPDDTQLSSRGQPQDPATCQFSGACRCDLAELEVEPCTTAFNLYFVDDCDNETVVPGDEANTCGSPDGVIDPYPAELQALNGVLNAFPRIFIELYTDLAGVPLELGEFTDLHTPERILPERWVGENFPVALQLNFAGGNPARLAFGMHAGIHQDLDGDGCPGASDTCPLGPGGTHHDELTLNVAIPVNKMAVTWSPVARHYHQDGAFGYDAANGQYDLIDLRCTLIDGQFPEDIPYCADVVAALDSQRETPIGEVVLEDVPQGQWRLTMITHTGQSWFVPNEVGDPALAKEAGVKSPMESNDDAFDPASQNIWLTTVDP